ncbi:hypothetical protein V5J35_001571 [Endozoicomonas sp. NE40]|uniref:Uncharacterized protein n=1 Tax=Endozoicomonas lisbonensis TaxID=3120522 RepID=A0ABV2SG88_9GAMM
MIGSSSSVAEHRSVSPVLWDTLLPGGQCGRTLRERRYLINERLHITGTRWSLQGAEVILKLRPLNSGEDLEEY